MKVGLLGDIHANAGALAAVLSAARELGVSRLLVTGDLVGYYFQPDTVLHQLADWPLSIVRGNHEEMLAIARIDAVARESIAQRYGSGIAVALERLSQAHLDWLCGLPHPVEVELEGCRILLCHGSPDKVDRYVYPDAPDVNVGPVAGQRVDLVVSGHTHYPMDRMVDGVRFVNPGSVGQPRNRQRGAHWAIFDTRTRHIQFRQEPYDQEALVAECRRRHPDLPYLAEVLERS